MNSCELMNSGAILADLANGKNLFSQLLIPNEHCRSKLIYCGYTIIQFLSFHSRGNSTASQSECEPNSDCRRRGPLRRLLLSLQTSLNHMSIEQTGLNCWNPQPSPVLRAPSQFCDWFFLGAAWPMGVNRTSSRLSFFTEPEGTGWSRVKVHILLPLLPLSAFSPPSPLIDALWSCSPSHRSPAVCFLSRWVLTWQSNSYCECERSAPLPHACVHACVHAHAHTHTTHTHILSSWTAAILIIMKQRHSDGEV